MNANRKNWQLSILGAAGLLFCTIAAAQSATRNRTLLVEGHSGEATIIQVRGRTYVDLEMLVQTVGGTLRFQGDQIVLNLSNATGAVSQTGVAASAPVEPGFSREFTSAALESLGTMREWASALAVIIKNGHPVGDAITDYRGRAVQSFRKAGSAASTPADRSALQLLTVEFNNVQLWSDNLVKARNSMSAANFALSDDALLNDPLSQKILRCWQFLGPMLASGSFQDDRSCH